MAVKVISPGLSTSVQDLGRPGYYHLGIPEGGGMDRFATTIANLLVGNEPGAALLEATFMGPELEFEQPAVVAVTGGDLPPKVNGVEQPGWESFAVKAGDKLSFGYLKSGARAYIAISGGIDVPLVLGSRTTYVLGALGGFEGRVLKAGDVLPLGKGSGKAGRSLPASYHRQVTAPVELRMVPGLYWHRITEAAGKRFFEDTWKVAPEADRIGYRFRGGTPLEFVPREPPFGAGSDPSNIVDACYPYGSVQVPSGTEPIVLHRDAVSGGGYMMLGVVISADMDLIAQLQPHTPARFAPVTLEQALAARAERRVHQQKAEDYLAT
ncbi:MULTISPECIES: biotin-dependent carboxyltransferase family protein [Mesorhizobium]|uniref:Biotin-dependent carboxyltransferase n=1 Tax=Mesorhizobium denitrificans TaxID=2294114 RepID=A0A371XIA8_9HYPH|nr:MULTISPECIES: biotin-dependent carboxyltransferase family protein [Mesorhizobium]RFC68953.1 biotin-dependent carboxyltransferase [Mesorhizobium denitrificans]